MSTTFPRSPVTQSSIPRDRAPVGVSIVIPTFQEAENLWQLLPQLADALERAELSGEILVVDDDSGDGTDAVCAKMGGGCSCSIRLITRRNQRGLASAVAVGLSQARGDVVVVMDADLSHPPDSVPALVSAVLTTGVDFAIGSRYVPGARVDQSWSLFRHWNSRFATFLARGLTTARDPLAGFFAIRREVWQTAGAINPPGYKIGLELIVRCDCRNIAEVPIVFADRAHGASKLNLRQQLLYLRHLMILYSARFDTAARFVRFGLVGLSGLVIDLLMFAAAQSLMSAGLARGLAIGSAMVWNYFLNRRFTFTETQANPSVSEFLYFGVACLCGAVVNWTVSLTLITTIGWPSLPAVTAGVAAGSVANFMACSGIVFSARSATEGRVRAQPD